MPIGTDPLVVRRLWPDAAELTLEEAVAGLDPRAAAPPDRPHVALNMVASADGKATLGGRTRGLGNAADRRLFHLLRSEADAVMAGAGTVRAERYGRIVRDPGLRERRARAGRDPDCPAVVVSGSLDLPPDLPLLAAEGQEVLVLTSSRDDPPPAAARVECLRSEGATDLPALLGRLRTERGIRALLCEGGPTLNAELLRHGLVDELFLSLSPLLVGGADALTIVAGEPLPEPVELELAWVLEHEGHLFLRLHVRVR